MPHRHAGPARARLPAALAGVALAALAVGCGTATGSGLGNGQPVPSGASTAGVRPTGQPPGSSQPRPSGAATASGRQASGSSGSSGSTGSGSATNGGTGAVPAVLPAALLRPALGCPSGMPVSVDHRAPLSAAEPTAIVVAHCVSAAGSPPSGVFVVTAGRTGARLSATLVPTWAELQVRSLKVVGAVVQVSGLGYSTSSVPRCCPDLTFQRSWRVRAGQLVPADPVR